MHERGYGLVTMNTFFFLLLLLYYYMLLLYLTEYSVHILSSNSFRSVHILDISGNGKLSPTTVNVLVRPELISKQCAVWRREVIK